MKLIDADKQIEWIKQELDKTPKEWPTSYECGRAVALKEVMRLLEGDSFSLTPPVQPDTPKLWDKVRHKDHPGEIGEVWEHPRVKARFEGQEPDYYRLDKLEVIKDDPST